MAFSLAPKGPSAQSGKISGRRKPVFLVLFWDNGGRSNEPTSPDRPDRAFPRDRNEQKGYIKSEGEGKQGRRDGKRSWRFEFGGFCFSLVPLRLRLCFALAREVPNPGRRRGVRLSSLTAERRFKRQGSGCSDGFRSWFPYLRRTAFWPAWERA